MKREVVVHDDPIPEERISIGSDAFGPRQSPSADKILAAVQLLWDRRALLYRVAFRGLLCSILIAILIPNKYDSTITVMPPDNSMSDSGAMLAALAGKAGQGVSAIAGNLLGAKTTGAVFVDLLRSRTVGENLVDRFQLQRVSVGRYKLWDRYKEDARKDLGDRTAIEEDRKSGIITISVRDRNKQRAHDIAQAYVDELNKLYAQVNTSSARRERMFIEQRLVSVKADLEDSEKRFSQFASKNTALDIKEQSKAMVESAAVLEGQLIAAQSELQGLEQIYTENNVRVRSLRARVADLRRSLQGIQGTDAPLNSYADQNGGDAYPTIRKLPLLGVEWADLYRKVKVQETVWELLNQQYELARIREAKEIPTVNVVDPANIPETKSFPPRLPIIIALTILIVLAAAAFILASAWWSDLDSGDSRKIFVSSVHQDVRERFHRWLEYPSVQRMRRILNRSPWHRSGRSGLL
jgi:capsule polysaccharide export protein KpsE/RkpR